MEEEIKQKKKKSKAFTLIELLAVITIMAILMLIAIPAVSRVIFNSRRDTYVATVKNITEDVKREVTNGELDISDLDTTYYVPSRYVEAQNGTKTPFGEFKDSYIIITFDSKNYHYYWASNDTAKMGMTITPFDTITRESVKANIEDINTDIAICGKPRIIVLDIAGNVIEEKSSASCYDGETNEIETRKLIQTIEQKTEGKLSPGDEIVVGEKEHFYVVSADQEKTLLIGKYNLYVGYNVKSRGDGKGYMLDGEIPKTDSNYGWQSSLTTDSKKALIPFSGKKYWQSATNENLFDDKYPDARDQSVYDSTKSTVPPQVTDVANSYGYYTPQVAESDYSIAYYIEPYVKKIRSLGLYVYEGNVISHEQASSIGCGYGGSCSSSWIRNTQFWTGSVAWMGQVRYQTQLVTINGSYSFDDYNKVEAGVRPIITIKTADIPLLDHDYFANKPQIVY